jgi:hypothetical protein
MQINMRSDRTLFLFPNKREIRKSDMKNPISKIKIIYPILQFLLLDNGLSFKKVRLFFFTPDVAILLIISGTPKVGDKIHRTIFL